jgi:hypothetical protein
LPKLKLLKDVTDTTAMSVHIHDLGWVAWKLIRAH